MKAIDVVTEELESTGLPWELAEGKKHIKVRLSGHMVGILPKSGHRKRQGNRCLMNVVGQIRRAAREIHGVPA